MSVSRPFYSTNVTDAEWQILEALVSVGKSGGRHRFYPMREVINAFDIC